jgi:hypothetical protein
MILDEFVEVSWSKVTKRHYIDKGYAFTNWGDKFKVKPIDLPVYSATLVNVQCDYCPYQRQIKYQYYKHDKYTCKKCSIKKEKKRMHESLFVKNPKYSMKQILIYNL